MMPSEPKPISRRPLARLSPEVFAGLLLGAMFAGAGLIVFVYLFNPGAYHFYPVCLFHELTGLNCPGCGTTRSLYALLHGNWRLAVKDNALFMLALVALAFWTGQFAVRRIRNQPMELKVRANLLWWVVGCAVVFGVLRNLPGFGWLSP